MGEAKRKINAGLVSADELQRRRVDKEVKGRIKPPPGGRVAPFLGVLFVLDSPTSWKPLDTLDPGLLPERQKLVTAAREGRWIPPVHLTKEGRANLRRDLPPGCGAGRYYLLADPPSGIKAWLEVTHLVSMVQG